MTTTTNPTGAANTSVFSQLGLSLPQSTSTTQGSGSGQLSQADFFNLLVTQLKNQDPLQPMDPNAFLSQMAQFSQLDGIQQMNSSVQGLTTALQSNQALQASTLVGRQVLVSGNALQLDSAGASATGAVSVPQAASSVTVTITDPSGAPVRTIQLGAQQAGQVPFTWDGTTDSGSAAPAGTYTVQAVANQNAAGAADLSTLVGARVQSVSLSKNPPGMSLNLQGVGSVDLSQVQQIL